jgi:hypothetical protein
MWQDAETIGTMYSAEGRPAFAFDDRGDHEIELAPFPIPRGADHSRGFMLTEAEARFVGSI